MLCSMCKPRKKMSRQVTEPTPSRLSSLSSPRKSKKFQRIASYIIPSSVATSSFRRDSYGSSISTRTPLPDLHDTILHERPHIYDFQEIISATQNFQLRPHSKSSSSTAWLCAVRGHLSLIFQRRFRRQMDTARIVERLSVICRSHHSSLVKLKGASISGNYIYLVYDYIPGANLADCLRNPKNPNFTVLSTWMSRIRVASDLAHGLDYVHNSTGLGFEFVHNHIKSSSIILLEQTLTAKLCHYGTSELCGEITPDEDDNSPKNYSNPNPELKKSSSKAKKFEGTRGYMAPEFQRSGIVTQKGDIFAFGVVILELLSGMEALAYEVDEESGSYTRTSVVDMARRAVESGGSRGVRTWVDKKLRDSYPVKVVENLTALALECVSDDPNCRPEMGNVAARVSRMFLESQDWADNMGVITDFTVSLGPR